MTLRIGEIAVTPAVVLAPMAGITDRPFREVVAGFGAGLVVSEMVVSAEMLTERPSARAKAEIAAGATGTAVQIAGRDPAAMAEAARRLAGEGAPLIDINMGCPAKKVTSGACGSALMREPARAEAIVAAVAGAVGVPVTVKMRLGWDGDHLNAPEIARRAVDSGARMITVHGRTRAQGYKGTADWGAVAAVTRAVPVPVVVNGDIRGPDEARAALAASGAAGAMVGRGAQGAPWTLAQVAAGLAGRPVPPRPRGARLADLVSAHLEAHCAFYPREVGVRAFRKHLDAYCAHVAGAGQLRERMMRKAEPAELLRLISGFADLEDERAAA